MIRKCLCSLTYAGILTIFTLSNLFAQSIPDKPNPPRLVNDFASMMNAREINALEQKLVAFNDSTTTQIAIVTVPSLDGTDISDYAQKLAAKWGLGQKGKDNGILILVKPKTADSRGYVKIAQGYGLEGALPDITCAEIVDYEILPAFKNGDIYGGLDNATNIIMSLVRGEFTAADYGKSGKKGGGKGIPIGPIIIGIFILISIISKASGGHNNKNISSGGLPFWLLMGMMGSGRGHGGSWGGFSGGSGGGGGFGGFGGGSFGGGGASGSW
jgi:uncharacterized protein